MKCADIRDLLAGHAAGLASDEESEAVRAHTDRCPACARRLAEVLPWTPPPEVGRRLAAALDALARPAPIPVRRGLLAIAAAAALLVAVALAPDASGDRSAAPTVQAEVRPMAARGLEDSLRVDSRPITVWTGSRGESGL